MRSGPFGVVTPVPYATACVLVVALVAAALVEMRRHRERSTGAILALVGVALLVDVVAYLVSEVVRGTFVARTSLPLSLCNAAVVVAALACFTRRRTLVEVTYFVGIAGTLQAVVTPDLSSPFPHLVFFEYLVGHLGIVAAAILLVAGAGLGPRRGAWLRVYGLVAAYTAVVGGVDWAFGADYMFLRKPPSNATLLSVLGPFPYYIASAAGVALVLFFVLQLPFSRGASPQRGHPVTVRAWATAIALGLFVWPAALVVPRRMRWGLLRRSGVVLARVLGIEIEVVGEPFSDGPVLYLANHASFVDGLVVALALTRPATFVVGAPIAKQKIAGTFLRALGAEFVGPRSGRAVREQLDRIARRLEAGGDVIGFPEGGLAHGDGVRRMRLGLFLAAGRASCWVVPVALVGTGEIVAPGTRAVRGGEVAVRFGTARRAEGDDLGAARALAEEVAADLTELLALGAPRALPVTPRRVGRPSGTMGDTSDRLEKGGRWHSRGSRTRPAS